MITAQLDKNGYFTGQFSTVGDLEGAVEVTSLPNLYEDPDKRCSYKLTDGVWKFNKKRYNRILADKNTEVLNKMRDARIKQSKENLQAFLNTSAITSTCHKGTAAQYSITSNKQQYLANMILTTTMAEQNGIPYQPSWNASGEPCTYDWTLAELQQLAMEIEAFVRPLILKQQQMEVSIREASSIEELQNIDLSFE